MAACGRETERNNKRPSRLADILHKLHSKTTDDDCASSASPYAAETSEGSPSTFADVANVADAESNGGRNSSDAELKSEVADDEDDEKDLGVDVDASVAHDEKGLNGDDDGLKLEPIEEVEGMNVDASLDVIKSMASQDADMEDDAHLLGDTKLSDAYGSATTDAHVQKTTSLSDVKGKGRSSRRKQQRTRKVVESEDDEDMKKTIDSYIDSDLSDYVRPPDTTDNKVTISPGAEGVLLPISAPELTTKKGDEKADRTEAKYGVSQMSAAPDVDAHELDGFVLPEGTVFVLPEAVESTSSASTSLEMDGTASRLNKKFKGLVGTIISCTACNRQLGIDHSTDVYRHPILKVLVCRKCYTTYSEATIEKDADGSDEQCRWCVQGGDLICCDFCHNAICKGCIRRNLGRKELNAILEADATAKWKCYICDPRPMLSLIDHCSAVMEALAKQERKQLAIDRRKKNAAATAEGAKNKVLTGAPPSQSASVIQSTSVASAVVAHAGGFNGGAKVFAGFGRGGGRGSQNPRLSSFPMQLVTNSRLAADQSFGAGATSNVAKHGQSLRHQGSVEQSLPTTIDRLMSATQSMGLFLNSLSTELRNVPIAATYAANGAGAGGSLAFAAKKRREVASKLWRAYRAYANSFQEIRGLGGLLGSDTGAWSTETGTSNSAPRRSSSGSYPAGGRTMVPTDTSRSRPSVVQSVSRAGLQHAPEQSRMGGSRVDGSALSQVRSVPTAKSSSVIKSASAMLNVANTVLRGAKQRASATTVSSSGASSPMRGTKRSADEMHEAIVIELSDSDEELIKDAASIAELPSREATEMPSAVISNSSADIKCSEAKASDSVSDGSHLDIERSLSLESQLLNGTA